LPRNDGHSVGFDRRREDSHPSNEIVIKKEIGNHLLSLLKSLNTELKSLQAEGKQMRLQQTTSKGVTDSPVLVNVQQQPNMAPPYAMQAVLPPINVIVPMPQNPNMPIVDAHATASPTNSPNAKKAQKRSQKSAMKENTREGKKKRASKVEGKVQVEPRVANEFVHLVRQLKNELKALEQASMPNFQQQPADTEERYGRVKASEPMFTIQPIEASQEAVPEYRFGIDELEPNSGNAAYQQYKPSFQMGENRPKSTMDIIDSIAERLDRLRRHEALKAAGKFRLPRSVQQRIHLHKNRLSGGHGKKVANHKARHESNRLDKLSPPDWELVKSLLNRHDLQKYYYDQAEHPKTSDEARTTTAMPTQLPAVQKAAHHRNQQEPVQPETSSQSQQELFHKLLASNHASLKMHLLKHLKEEGLLDATDDTKDFHLLGHHKQFSAA
jgi:hypothetical protein